MAGVWLCRDWLARSSNRPSQGLQKSFTAATLARSGYQALQRRNRPMLMTRFLAATDGTRDGDHAVRMGQTLAQQADGEFARLAVETSAPNWEPGLERWKEP